VETSNALLALAALAQETRLAVYRLLVEHAPDGLPAGDYKEEVSVDGSPVQTKDFKVTAS